ncbi:MAG: hypothetical protein Q8O82_04845 [Pseudorhodobacter sp.]|nr:hypothetical protein [Pseudorhodobacter sp.]
MQTLLEPSLSEQAAPMTSVAEAAHMMNVSERSVMSARKVQELGAPELVAAVESDMASVSAAADVATLPCA